jgi:hypothetical protein
MYLKLLAFFIALFSTLVAVSQGHMSPIIIGLQDGIFRLIFSSDDLFIFLSDYVFYILWQDSIL